MICAQLAVDASEQGLSDLGGAAQCREGGSEVHLPAAVSALGSCNDAPVSVLSMGLYPLGSQPS